MCHQMKVLAGPLLRRMLPQRLTLWLATNQKVDCALQLFPKGAAAVDVSSSLLTGHTQLKAGEMA